MYIRQSSVHSHARHTAASFGATALSFALLLACSSALATTTAEQVFAEEQGIDLPQPEGTVTHTATAKGAGGNAYLLIPESTNDRVMAFDPITGDLINADFIPADPNNLSTPIHAILSADGASILVSDQIDDVVQQYDLTGNHIGVFAPAGGVDTAILDNIRGMALLPNGNLLVSVGGGANADAIAEFDTAGNYLGNFVANAADGLDSPFDIAPSGANYLVGGISSDTIHRFNASGAPLASLAPIDTFPEQVLALANGNTLVGNFSGSQEGVVEFDPAGSVVGVYNPPGLGGYRGVYELPNGNILTTNGNGVHEIDRSGNLIETKISGVSARFISLLAPPRYLLDVTVAGQGQVDAGLSPAPVSGGISACMAGSGNCAATYAQDDVVTLTATPATDWHFVSWGGDCSGTSSPIAITMDADKTCTASFAIDQYTVTPTTTGNGSINPDVAQLIDAGSTTAFTVTPDANWHIETVTGCGGSLTGNVYTTAAITADCTVTAAFAIDTVTVSTGIGDGNGSINPASVEVPFGGTQVFTLDPGYIVASATGCGGTLAGNQFTTGPITTPCSVVGHFALALPAPHPVPDVIPATDWRVLLLLAGIASLVAGVALRRQ